jgi:hypothetical protein
MRRWLLPDDRIRAESRYPAPAGSENCHAAPRANTVSSGGARPTFAEASLGNNLPIELSVLAFSGLILTSQSHSRFLVHNPESR